MSRNYYLPPQSSPFNPVTTPARSTEAPPASRRPTVTSRHAKDMPRLQEGRAPGGLASIEAPASALRCK